jgi:hypothetical protein
MVYLDSDAQVFEIHTKIGIGYRISPKTRRAVPCNIRNCIRIWAGGEHFDQILLVGIAFADRMQILQNPSNVARLREGEITGDGSDNS